MSWFAEWELAAGDSIAERIDAARSERRPRGLAFSGRRSLALGDQELCAIAAVPALTGDCEIPRPLSNAPILICGPTERPAFTASSLNSVRLRHCICHSSIPGRLKT